VRVAGSDACSRTPPPGTGSRPATCRRLSRVCSAARWPRLLESQRIRGSGGLTEPLRTLCASAAVCICIPHRYLGRFVQMGRLQAARLPPIIGIANGFASACDCTTCPSGRARRLSARVCALPGGGAPPPRRDRVAAEDLLGERVERPASAPSPAARRLAPMLFGCCGREGRRGPKEADEQPLSAQNRGDRGVDPRRSFNA